MACFQQATRPDGFFVATISAATKMPEVTLNFTMTISFYILSYSFLAVIQSFNL